jgi:hypothetical protein
VGSLPPRSVGAGTAGAGPGGVGPGPLPSPEAVGANERPTETKHGTNYGTGPSSARLRRQRAISHASVRLKRASTGSPPSVPRTLATAGPP